MKRVQRHHAWPLPCANSQHLLPAAQPMFHEVQRHHFLKRFVGLGKHRHSDLRRRGRHIQVGLLLAEQSTPAIPMSKVIAHELEILGSHGMQAHRYAALFALIEAGRTGA
jgi:hypothetical protein